MMLQRHLSSVNAEAPLKLVMPDNSKKQSDLFRAFTGPASLKSPLP
jgi:hypothetical protein